MSANERGLGYTIEGFAKELGIRPENISILIKLDYIKPIKFGQRSLRISIYEAERFLVDNAGKNFEEIIKDYKKREHLNNVNQKIVSMKEARA
ncbi:hypothetical protein [Enterococcus sp. DIV0800]|uniref:hypothetical protein n=1 Tax=unclassified Enterococcus TaxID=2608891 RepID=UPI003D2FC242